VFMVLMVQLAARVLLDRASSPFSIFFATREKLA